MKYRIVERENPEDLQIAVNHWIRDGWIPIGGPMFVQHRINTCYYQAMTLEEKSVDEVIKRDFYGNPE